MSWGRFLAAPLLVALVFVTVSPACAEEPEGRVSLGFSFGVVTSAMDDVNRLIDLGNTGIGDGTATGTKGLEKIKAGFQFASELRARLNPWLVVGAGAESDVLKKHVNYNYIYNAEARAVPVQVTAYWYSPWGAMLNEDLDFFAGAGFTSLQNVEVTYHAERDVAQTLQTRRTEELIFKGTGAGVHALAGFEYLLTPRMTFLGEIGYRRVKAKNLKPERKISDARNQNLQSFEFDYLKAMGNPKSLDADFSGVEGKITFRFYLL
jgi:hypothetical protein